MFPSPAVKIKQPISFFDQPNIFPKILNRINANPNDIQAIEAGSSKSKPNFIFGQ